MIDYTYTKLDSAHLRNLIRRTPWRRRGVVDDLILLRHYIIEGPRSYAESLGYRELRRKYGRHYWALLAERSPEAYERALAREREEQQRRREEKIRCLAEERRRLARDRRDWLAAGGKRMTRLF